MRLLMSLLCAVLLLVGLAAYGAVSRPISSAPRVMSFQGKLTDTSGVPMTGTFEMTFRLWDAAAGGTMLFQDVHSSVVVDDEGLYNVEMSIPTSVTFQDPAWLGVEVDADGEMTPRYRLTSSPYAFWAIDAGMLEGNTLADLDLRFVNEGQVNSITSVMILDGEIVDADVSATADIDPTKIKGTACTGAGTAGYVVKYNGPTTLGNSVIYQSGSNIGVGTTTPTDRLAVSGRLGVTDKANIGPGCSNPGANAFAVGNANTASGSYATVTGGRMNVASRPYATVGGGYYNNATYDYATVGGGYRNLASRWYATVGGGYNNRASYDYATVGGGYYNTASRSYATVGGGYRNNASYYYSTIGGGYYNNASYYYSTVGGGYRNNASYYYSTVGGGGYNSASQYYATVGGGYRNTATRNAATVGGGYYNNASYYYSTVGGGYRNTASGYYSTVPGGYRNRAYGYYSFAAGRYSYVPSNRSNSAAFNGQTATSSSQTRVGLLSKAAGSFTIDHPVDPTNKILNHYFVESPEMVLIYRGVAHIGENGRAEVHLPDYFDALNRKPMVQLTGVGTYEVFIAENVRGNSFIIGGKSGTEVHWTVTGDRKDQSAEIARIIMPVEQPKDKDLAGRSLDDEFLVSTKAQLEEMGQAGRFQFRTQAGRERYEESRRAPETPETDDLSK